MTISIVGTSIVGVGLSCRPPASRCKLFDVDNAWLKSERFLIGSVCFLTYCERSTNFACSESILILTFDRCDLLLQDRPIYDKHLHIDHVRAYNYEKHDLARNDH